MRRLSLGKQTNESHMGKRMCPLRMVLRTYHLIYKKSESTSCENHSTISLVTPASKLLTRIIVLILISVRRKQIRKNQAGCRPGDECTDHKFTFNLMLEHSRTSRRLALLIFLDLKATFDPVKFVLFYERCPLGSRLISTGAALLAGMHQKG